MYVKFVGDSMKCIFIDIIIWLVMSFSFQSYTTSIASELKHSVVEKSFKSENIGKTQIWGKTYSIFCTYLYHKIKDIIQKIDVWNIILYSYNIYNCIGRNVNIHLYSMYINYIFIINVYRFKILINKDISRYFKLLFVFSYIFFLITI